MKLTITFLLLLGAVGPALGQQSKMSKDERVKFCKASRECRTGVSPGQWVACMKRKGFKTKAGDGFRICGKG